jgi:hypothetical protein
MKGDGKQCGMKDGRKEGDSGTRGRKRQTDKNTEETIEFYCFMPLLYKEEVFNLQNLSNESHGGPTCKSDA